MRGLLLFNSLFPARAILSANVLGLPLPHLGRLDGDSYEKHDELAGGKTCAEHGTTEICLETWATRPTSLGHSVPWTTLFSGHLRAWGCSTLVLLGNP